MKKSTIYALPLLFATIMPFTGNAQAAEQLYGGLKIGNMLADPGNYTDATNIGFVIGMPISKGQGFEYAVEGELTTTISDGDVTVLGNRGSWDINTAAIYGVARYGSQYYAKAKIGILHENVGTGISGASFSGSDTGLSLGVGIGWQASNKVRAELEYTIVENDVSYLSLGVNYRF